VDLLHNDNESVSVGARSAASTTGSGVVHRSSSQSSEINSSTRPPRSSRRQSRNGSSDGEQSRQRRSSDGAVRQRTTVMPPSYEVAAMQGSAATIADIPSAPMPVYHPSPGVSRQASELTEEEQIKIAQRIGLIQHLPIDIYVEGNKTDTECIICMAEFVEGDRVRFLPCMHTYHVDCIDEWLMRSFSCPSCLEPVDSALLTSYDQQQLAAFTEIGLGTGADGDGATCQSLPRQLEQLTAVTSPSASASPITDHSNRK